MTESVLLERPAAGVALLRLNRPEKRNAMNGEMLGRLFERLDEVDEDDACRVLILTGAGAGFCAGLDLEPGILSNSRGTLGGPQRLLKSMRQGWTRLLPRLRAMRPAMIAAVNGAAVGGGFVLSLGCDVRIASTEASFRDGFAKVGVSGFELGLSWLLPRMIGVSSTMELALTGRVVEAREALRLGLVHQVCAPDELMAAALRKAEAISANPPFSVWMTRNALWNALEVSSLQAAIELENRTQALCLLTEDAGEQRASRGQRRSPAYRNR